MNKDFEIIVVGGGPAGISAGIYALRAGSRVVVFDNGASSLDKAKIIQNYYGIESISGKDLKNKGIEQFKKLGGTLINKEIVQIQKDFDKNTFVVKTSSEEYECKAVILCSGTGKKKTIEGLQRYENENVSYCAVCDGFFYKGKNVAVIGDGEFAKHECEELAKNAKTVYLITNCDRKIANFDKNVRILNKKIKDFEGEARINRIVFEDNNKVDVDGVFVALGTLSSFEIAKQLGVITVNNFIKVDRNYMTNIAGAFSAGDCIGGLLQVVKAVSDGAQAGLEAVRYIKFLEL